MRKKQLFAILLTGALTVGMAPSAAFAAEDATALSIEGAEDAGDTGADITPEEPQTPPEDDGQGDAGDGGQGSQDGDGGEPATPTPDEPQQPTETPTQTPQEPTTVPEEQDENVAKTKETPEATATPTPEVKAGAIMIGETAYPTLAEAVAAAPASANPAEEPTKILLTGDLELTETIKISDSRNILIVAAAENTTINRQKDFKGDMFQVESGVLQFGAGVTTSQDGTETKSGSLLVDGSLEEASAEGSIVAVAAGATFGLLDGVTMTGNTTTENGGAVRNAGGNVVLMGGAITGNQAVEGGAIYSEGVVTVQGTVNISENKKSDGETASNIALKAPGVIHVSGKMEGSKLGVTYLEGAEGTQVVAIGEGVTDVTLADVLPQITYDEPDSFVIDENGKLKAAEVTPSPTPTEALKLTGKSMKWIDHNSAKITCVSNKDGWYYADWVTRGAKAPEFDLEKEGIPVKADQEFTVTLTNFDSDNAIDVYVRVKDKDNNLSKKLLFQLDEGKRPADPNVTPTTRPARVPKVTESVVTGLDNPLEFYPGQYYKFNVIGAGTDNNDPVVGDVKWVPLYWGMSANPSKKYTDWTVGSGSGIRDAGTYNIYIFFQKWQYDGNDWQQTDSIESAAYQFKSKAITFATITPSVTGQQGSNGNGDGTDPQNKAADGSTTGASTASAVSTADESPVGSMLTLAALSILAGGYVLVRRRKKEME